MPIPRRALVALSLALPSVLAAQAPAPFPGLTRAEVGVRSNLVDLRPCAGYPPCDRSYHEFALGATAAFRLSRGVSFEAMLDGLPANKTPSLVYPDGSVSGGRPLHFVAGPAFAARGGPWAIVASPRIGLVSYGAAPGNGSPITVVSSISTVPSYALKRETFLTVGAVFGVERSFTPHMRLRVELGDEFRDYRQASLRGTAPSPAQGNDRWGTSLTFATGISYALGPSLPHRPGPEIPAPAHRFMDRRNAVLLSASVLAQAADAITTQRFVRYGAVEGDAVARPLVEQGWPGQIALAGLFTGAEVGAMYVVHRWGYHRLERLIPAVDAIASGTLAYTNVQYVPTR